MLNDRDVVVGARRRWWQLVLGTRLRCAIVLLSMAGAVFQGRILIVGSLGLVLVIVEVVADRLTDRRARLASLCASAVLVLLTVALALHTTPAVLLLLLVPAYRAGDQHGRRAALAVPAFLGAGLALVLLTWDGADPPVFASLQWWALALGLAQLGVLGRSVETERARPGTAAAREAGELLGRLQDLARQLPTGLDVAAVATMLMDEVGAAVRSDRAAVLVRVGHDEVSPVALAGVERVPWRDPVREPGTPHDAWTQRRLVHDVREADASGRRTGSATLAVPIADRDDELLGLLVLERTSPQPFEPADLLVIADVCDRLAPHLHAALAFDELRHVSEVAERERLAREMHDGVAQDLSALGFALDAAAKRAAAVDPGTATLLTGVRAELNRTIRDIRLSISDLRSSVRAERGLGAAISSHVQSMGTHSDISVTVSLQESAFRLPSHQEFALLRLTQDFLSDARTRGSATSLRVELETYPPRALLQLSRDGEGGWEPDELLVSVLEDLGAEVSICESAGLVVASVELGGRPAGAREQKAAAGPAVPIPLWSAAARKAAS